MAGDPWQSAGGDAIGGKISGAARAIEERVHNKADRPMEYSGGHHRVLSDECVQPSRIFSVEVGHPLRSVV
eukprot:5367264-Pyramimonas_sp.AAC.1